MEPRVISTQRLHEETLEVREFFAGICAGWVVLTGLHPEAKLHGL